VIAVTLVSLAEVELLTIRIRLLVCSLDKAEIGRLVALATATLARGATTALAEHDEPIPDRQAR
jgi:hypothetical protein